MTTCTSYICKQTETRFLTLNEDRPPDAWAGADRKPQPVTARDTE